MHDLSEKPTIRQDTSAARAPLPGDVACGRFESDDDASPDSACDRATSPGDACPHVDRNDARCSHRFSLGRIEQAFSVCFGAFHACPLFRRLNHEFDLAIEDLVGPPPIVEVRIIARRQAGRAGCAGVGGGLRATGS